METKIPGKYPSMMIFSYKKTYQIISISVKMIIIIMDKVRPTGRVFGQKRARNETSLKSDGKPSKASRTTIEFVVETFY